MLLLLCVFAASGLLRAQSATQGSLAGTVTDASGAAVPHTVLQLESAASHARIALSTDDNGVFHSPALEPGYWTITSEANDHSQLQLDIAIGRTTTLALLLTHGSLQSVTVDDSVLEESAALSSNMPPTDVASLPVNASSWSNLALLAPTSASNGVAEEVSFRALSSDLNYRTVDGSATTAAFAAPDSPRGRAAFTLSQSAVREFQVNVANYSAQYGRAAGAVINTVTLRGEQQFHGNAFFYDRDTSWLSRTPGVQLLLPQPDGTLVPQQLPGDYRLQGGISAGGRVPGVPHARNVYWHYTYDQQDRNDPALATITNAPQLALSQAQASQFPGDNPACVNLTGGPTLTGPLRSTGSETDPTLYGTQGACFLNLDESTLYPTYAAAAAAYNNALAYVYSLLGQAPRRSTLISNLPRFDVTLPHGNSLTLAWNAIRSQATAGGDSQPFVNKSVTSLGDDHLSLNDVSARLNTLLSPRLDNELRIGYAHDSESQTAQPPLPQEPHTALNGTAAPGVRIAETLTLGTPDQLPRAQYPRESRLQFADAVAFTRRTQTFHIGVDILHTDDAVSALESQAGFYKYDNMQDFLIDVASQIAAPARHCGETSGGTEYLCYASYEQGFGTPALSFSGNQYAFYAQDDWRVFRNFTLNVGARYDYQQLPPPQLPNSVLAATQQFHADRNNFAPRLGFALQLPRAHSTVLRGGYGLFYATTPGTTLFAALANTGIVSAQSRGQARYTFASASATYSAANPPEYPAVLPTPPNTMQALPNVTVLAPNFQQPSVQQADLTLETALTPRTTLEATGLLSLARDLPVVVDTNLPSLVNSPLPTTVTYQFTGGGPLNGQTVTVPFYAGPRPNSNFRSIQTVESRGNATYSELTFGLRHASGRWDLRGHYTWARAIDFGDQAASATHSQVLEPGNFALERGDSTLDRRNRLLLAGIYTPGLTGAGPMLRNAINGWRISTILQTASGSPYSATVTGTAPAQENSIGSQTIYPTTYGYLGAGGADFLPQLGRNRYRAPLTQTTDLRVARKIPTGWSRLHIEAAAEAFNLFNHRNVSAGGSDSAVNTIAYRIGSGQAGLGTSTPALATWQPNFGQPVAANATNLFTTRQLQFSLRGEF
jgi:hypothetical protein